MGDVAYAAAKLRLVSDALAAQGLSPKALHPLLPGTIHSRRRATIKLWQDETGSMCIGFAAERSHVLVPIEACLVLEPALLAFAKAMAASLAGLSLGPATFPLSLTRAREGIDLDITSQGKEGMARNITERLVTAARAAGAVRVTMGNDVLYQAGPPHVEMDGVPVRLPQRSFLQAVAASQTAMNERVAEIVRGAKRIADLFAGLGTFSLPLSRKHTVHAVEGDEAAAACLKDAASTTSGRKPLTVECRDLFRRPLLPTELEKFDAVVLDPPFQGAREQCADLARAKIPAIAYVSCSPASFARDAALLVKGGWHLGAITPIDQFLWSRQVELVAAFTRAG